MSDGPPLPEPKHGEPDLPWYALPDEGEYEDEPVDGHESADAGAAGAAESEGLGEAWSWPFRLPEVW